MALGRGVSERGRMAGHEANVWDKLCVVHVAHGRASASLQTRLICKALARFPYCSTSISEDPRGLSRSAINFVYIALKHM